MARFGDADVERLLGDAGIVRSRAKILAAVGNARAYLDMRDQGEDFSTFIWSFVDGRPIQNHWPSREAVPAETQEARALSKALKARRFKFVGPVIVYAFMQAVGMANDHTTDCFRHGEVRRISRG